MTYTNKALIIGIVFGLGILSGYKLSERSNKQAQPITVNTEDLQSESPTEIDRGIWNVSAYCCCEKCCNKNENHPAFGITASGYKIKPGDKLVAAPPEILFDTVINIPGYGKVPVLDRGGAIKGRKLDVLFWEKSPDPSMTDSEYSHKLARKWGRQFINVKF